MQIQPTSNIQTNSFKALSTVRIPVNNSNSSKLLVQVEHKGDFYALKWRKVIVNTLEKGKNIATKIIMLYPFIVEALPQPNFSGTT